MANKMISISTEPYKNIEEILKVDNLLFGVASFLHCDVMDKVFVSQKMLFDDEIFSISKSAKLPLDIHLMTMPLGEKYEKYLSVSPKILTLQFEAFKDKNEMLEIFKQIKNHHILAGVAINPSTDIEKIKSIIPFVDLVLIMSVKAGFGGQQFQECAYEKVKELKKFLITHNNDCLIEVDGGINDKIASKLFLCGADILVSGNFIFKEKNKILATKKLLEN